MLVHFNCIIAWLPLGSSWEIYDALWKNSTFSMQHMELFVSFCQHFLQRSVFQKNWTFLVVLQSFQRSSEKFPRMVFILICNQKLSCSQNTFSPPGFYDYQKLLSWAHFYYYIKMGLFREFILVFTEYFKLLTKKWNDLKVNCQLLDQWLSPEIKKCHLIWVWSMFQRLIDCD